MKAPTTWEKTEDKAVGRPRGGLNTKIYAIVDGLSNSVEFLLLASNDHDSVHAVELLKKVNIRGSNILRTGHTVWPPSASASRKAAPATSSRLKVVSQTHGRWIGGYIKNVFW